MADNSSGKKGKTYSIPRWKVWTGGTALVFSAAGVSAVATTASPLIQTLKGVQTAVGQANVTFGEVNSASKKVNGLSDSVSEIKKGLLPFCEELIKVSGPSKKSASATAANTTTTTTTTTSTTTTTVPPLDRITLPLVSPSSKVNSATGTSTTTVTPGHPHR